LKPPPIPLFEGAGGGNKVFKMIEFLLKNRNRIITFDRLNTRKCLVLK